MVREDALVAAYTRKVSKSSDDGANDSLLSSIKRCCEQRLPAYCVPSRFVCIADGRLPHTRNGKLDTAQLERIVSAAIAEQDKAAMELSADNPHDSQKGTRRAGSALEESIAEAWSLALNLSTDEIGLSRSFASLGGDSIKAVRVAAHLRRRGLSGLKDVSVGAILACKTIEAYATRQLELEQAREQSHSVAPLPFQATVSAKPARFSLLAKSRRCAPSVAAA
ncbi:uncharacterized protein SRS1_21030 [Sporisorium reilianum f. sp. reilianum]|uniref:Carrier domain-containing protein n=1 Tax=Sporisorium reilianum f. sp. reilianum TaxID=72559 RepID=A0A2N8UNF2_9BASI|nr:uncharacterized protein SRS1_21030 [Sporisorium reilianum f. sp. reilianum]